MRRALFKLILIKAFMLAPNCTSQSVMWAVLTTCKGLCHSASVDGRIGVPQSAGHALRFQIIEDLLSSSCNQQLCVCLFFWKGRTKYNPASCCTTQPVLCGLIGRIQPLQRLAYKSDILASICLPRCKRSKRHRWGDAHIPDCISKDCIQQGVTQ